MSTLFPQIPLPIVLGLLFACSPADEDTSSATEGSTTKGPTTASTSAGTMGETETETAATTDGSTSVGSGSDASTDDPTTNPTQDTEPSTTDDPSTDTDTDGGCVSDDDCVDDPDGPVCDLDAGLCVMCSPGVQEACYTAPGDTLDVGACVGGTKVCLDDGTGFGPCEGEVTPVTEVCGNNIDDNCNGETDEDSDLDSDGWTACGGDCCDIAGIECLNPELVNPGAYEVEGNEVDDNCNGDTDEAALVCDQGIVETSQDPDDFARAIDLCQFTTLNPPEPEDRIWGVIGSAIKLPNDQPLEHWEQVGVPTNYGPNLPQKNHAMAVLSSGWASDTAASAEWGKGWGVIQDAPAQWIAHHNGYLPKNPGCGQDGKTIRDPSMLELTVRAPTNALSFSVDLNFFNAEYPEWVCGQYQDMFVALIDAPGADNPADNNVAIFDDGMDGQFPIGVNLARDSGLFRQCGVGSQFGCLGSDEQAATSCEGVDGLIGTPYGANDAGCDVNHQFSGGATGWLRMHGNVVPGELFTIRMFVFDAGESGSGLADALVLLDNWEWDVEASAPGVVPM